MDISEVSNISGLKPSTLRFYEEIGLIRSTGRRGLRRLYAPSIVEQLALIALGQSSGFSLTEIKIMFAAKGKINRAMLLSKATELENKIKELKAMSKGLRHAAACNAPNHFMCRKFLRLLRIAGRARSRVPVKLRVG